MGRILPHTGNFLAEQTTIDAVAGGTAANVLTNSFVRTGGFSDVLLKRFELRATDSFWIGKVARNASFYIPE
jgi:hypothetical protein